MLKYNILSKWIGTWDNDLGFSIRRTGLVIFSQSNLRQKMRINGEACLSRYWPPRVAVDLLITSQLRRNLLSCSYKVSYFRKSSWGDLVIKLHSSPYPFMKLCTCSLPTFTPVKYHLKARYQIILYWVCCQLWMSRLLAAKANPNTRYWFLLEGL